MKKFFIIIIFVVIAAVFGILGYKFAGSSQPIVIENTENNTETLGTELPQNFPKEFLTEDQPQNLAVSTLANQTSLVYTSSLKPMELFDKLLASVQDKKWAISSPVKSEFQIQVLANYYKEETVTAMVEVWFTKVSEASTRVSIRYENYQNNIK